MTVCRPHVHSEIRFADGRTFSAQAGEGVRWKPSIETDHPWWDVIELPWRESPEVVRWCQSQVGLPYNWVGAINSGFGLDYTRANEWFCSQISIEVMSRCGATGIPALLSPEALYRWVQGHVSGKPRGELLTETLNLETVACEKYYLTAKGHP